MAKYLSNRQQNLKIGIVSYTENKTVLEVTGKVGIGTTNATSKLWVNGDGYFTGILTANRIFSSQYGEFVGGSISGTSLVGTSLSISGISTLDVTSATSIVVGSGVTINASGINASGIATASQLSTGASGTGINITTNTISGPATLTIDPAAVGDNTGLVVIKGDLQIDGTTTTINSTTVTVDDKNIVLGSGAINDAAADGSGITIESGNGNKTFQFEDTGDNLGSSENINVISGKVYKINNTSVLSSTTLGSGVINSSLTSVGTLTNLNVGNVYSSGIVTATTFVGALTGTASNVTTNANLTGDVTSVGNATAIAAGVIVDADINASAGIVDTKLATISTAGKVSNSATTATNANTASAIVARDASGNFSAGTITANLTGNAATASSVVNTVAGTGSIELVRGNMADNDQFRILVGGTATNAGYVEIATADDGTEPIYVRQYTGVFSSLTRTATLLDGSGNTSFPGTVSGTNITSGGNVTGNAATVTTNANLTGDVTSVGNATAIAAGVIVDADINASAGIVDTKLATISTALKVSNSATTATNANTASAIVARDASGNFSAGTITASLTGNAATATNVAYGGLTGAVPTWNQNTTGSAGSVDFNNLTSKASGSGTYTTSGDFRAPIFYDSNNTAYYTDPASTSNFNRIQSSQIYGNTEFAASDNSSTSYSVASIELRESQFGGSSGYLAPRISWHWGGVVASQIGMESSGRITVLNNPGSGYEALIGSILYGNDSVRAPIFYDSNNTAYYTDPASTSNLNSVTAVDFNSTSDIKLKTNVTQISNSIEKISQLNGVSFNWKNTNKPSLGVIAQEVEKVFPELVNDSETKTVNYNGLIGVLIEAIKEQQIQINDLKNMIINNKE